MERGAKEIIRKARACFSFLGECSTCERIPADLTLRVSIQTLFGGRGGRSMAMLEFGNGGNSWFGRTMAQER